MDVIFAVVFVILLYALQRNFWNGRLQKLDQFNQKPVGIGYVDLLFSMHFLLFIVYYVYAALTASDSVNYYNVSSEALNWISTWGTDSQFVAFLTYPFSNWLGLSYSSTMVVFAFIGFQGILLFYFVAKENVFGLKPMFGSFTLVELIFLLPNIHFWSSSIGKGGLMMLGIGLIVYGLSRYTRTSRKLMIVIGAFLIYMLRPHILFVVVLGIGTAMFFTFSKVKWYVKLVLIALSVIVIYFISDNLVEYSGSENLNIFESKGLAKRANDLSYKARSGVDIKNYNQLQKLFTFWYRPLFIDSPGVLGFIVSFENILYLFFTFQMIRYGPRSWGKWNGLMRILFFIFLYGSISLAQIAGNLGIAMRQKAQIMPLLFIVYSKTISLKNNRKRS